MSFLVVVIVFVLMQYLVSPSRWQKDEWLLKVQQSVRSWSSSPSLSSLLAVIIPVLLLWCVLALLGQLSMWLVFLAAIPVLFYSLGREDVKTLVSVYTDASQRKDNEVATQQAESMGADVASVDDWIGLNRVVLQRVGYLGLQKWFVPIFWFLILGPVGAFLYRVASVSREKMTVDDPISTEEIESDDQANLEESSGLEESSVEGESETESSNSADDSTVGLPDKLCWFMEWPVVRLLGLTFALTGNFVSCLVLCRDHVWSTEASSEEIMEKSVHGALNINESDLVQDSITEKELEEVPPLLQRSLILWLCVLALISLF